MYRPTGFVADQLFPVLPVKKRSDLYYVWDKGQRFRLERSDGRNTMRADGARSKQVNFGFTTANYSAEEWALSTFVTDEERDNQDQPLQLEVSKVQGTQDLLLLDYELRVANLVTTTGNYDSTNFTTLAGTSQWNNASFASQTNGNVSVIKQNLDDGKEAIRKATGGLDPNVIVVPAAVERVMARDLGFADLLKHNSAHPDLLTNGDLPPTIFGMRVLRPRAVYTSTVEGETETYTDVWGKNVIMAYVAPNPGLNIISFGYSFRSRPWQVKTWREEAESKTMYEPSMVQDEKLTAKGAGYLIQNAIA